MRKSWCIWMVLRGDSGSAKSGGNRGAAGGGAYGGTPALEALFICGRRYPLWLRLPSHNRSPHVTVYDIHANNLCIDLADKAFIRERCFFSLGSCPSANPSPRSSSSSYRPVQRSSTSPSATCSTTCPRLYAACSSISSRPSSADGCSSDQD